jgi:L-ascorbate metabolism protein UlaG (beta-lactamase superfamily)
VIRVGFFRQVTERSEVILESDALPGAYSLSNQDRIEGRSEMHDLVLLTFLLIGSTGAILAESAFESDVLPTSAGNLTMTFIGHGTLMFRFDGTIIHLDPWSKLAEYSKLPKADLILITHEHRDHLDPAALQATRKPGTVVLHSASCRGKVEGGKTMVNGESGTFAGIRIEAVPAYNIVHKRDSGEPFHPRGAGNGYILTFGDKQVYVAGDTENTPEMKNLKGIDVAFLPMNLPYTMTPEMVADAAGAFKPGILYPYHYSETDPQRLVDLLKDSGIEVRVRKLR